MRIPTITREIHQVDVERKTIEAHGVRFESRGLGDAKYSARTINGDYIDISRSEFDWLSAALAGMKGDE